MDAPPHTLPPFGEGERHGGRTEARRLDPRVRTVWWISGLLWALAASAAAVLADHPAVAERLFFTLSPGWLPATVGVLSFTMALVLPPIRYRRWRYMLRERDLWIRRGIVWVTVSVIPYVRLQFVDTEQGPLERVLGLASLVVHTAAPGTSGMIPGLDLATAEELRERLAALEDDDRADAV